MSAGASGESAARAEGIRRAAIAVLAAVLAVRVLLLPVLAWNSRYVMDEFSQASFPRYLTWGFYGAFDPIKTVLYVYVYGVAHLAADRAVDLLHVARMEGALLALLVAGFTWGISRRLGRGRFQSWFAVAVLFSFTNFMERSFRIRSDTVAVFFASAAALAAVWSDGPRAAFLSGALAAAAFLSTQKAAYAVVALGLAFAASGFGAGARRAFARIAAYGGGIAAALLAYAAWFDFGQPFRVLSMVFLSPLRYAPLHDNPFYAGIRRAYVTQTLVRNPVSYGLAVIGLGLVLARFRTVPPRLRLTAVAAAVVAVLVFRHEQPWPYVFVMALPFLSLFAPDAVDWAEGRAGSGGPWVRLAAVALLLWQLPRNFAYLRVDNWVQNDVVRYAESLLAPGDRYFDAIAMVPTRDSSYPVSWEALVLARTRAPFELG